MLKIARYWLGQESGNVTGCTTNDCSVIVITCTLQDAELWNPEKTRNITEIWVLSWFGTAGDDVVSSA